MSKSEERLKRKLDKQKKKLAKSVKQFELPNPKKVVQTAVCPVSLKKVKTTPLKSNTSQNMMWSRDHEDRKGKWSWGVNRDWGKTIDGQVIKPFLKEYEKKNWAEIRAELTGETHNRRRKHRSYDLEQIKKEAQARLEELELDDRETIFRFRITGPQRLYGIVIGHIFCTIWFDPTHEIYGS